MSMRSASASGRRLRARKACSAMSASSRTRLPKWSRANARSSPATDASSMPSAAEHKAWLESLSPWPEEFGLARMEQLLSALGDPQRSFPAVHVVGTNGKTTTTRLIEALFSGEGLTVGAYTSPHVLGWAERIRVRGVEVDLERALNRVRGAAEETGATQFEVLTAAAFAEVLAQEVGVAV